MKRGEKMNVENAIAHALKYLDGWKCDVSKVRKWEDLPENAQKYILYIEKAIGCPIKYISVGQERNAYIKR